MTKNSEKTKKKEEETAFGIFVIVMLLSHVCLFTTNIMEDAHSESETVDMIGVFEDEEKEDLVSETRLEADPILLKGGISYEFEDNVTDSDIYDDISENIENFDGLTNITHCSCCICSSFQIADKVWYKIEVVLDIRYLVFCILGVSVAVFICVAVKKLSHARKQLRLWRLTGRTDLRYVNRKNANLKVQYVNEKGYMNLNSFKGRKNQNGHNSACLKLGMILLAKIENRRYFACQNEKWA